MTESQLKQCSLCRRRVRMSKENVNLKKIDDLVEQAVKEFAKHIPDSTDESIQQYKFEALKIVKNSGYHFEQLLGISGLKGLNKGDLKPKVAKLNKKRESFDLTEIEKQGLSEYELYRELYVDDLKNGKTRKIWSLKRAMIYGFYEELSELKITKTKVISLVASFAEFLRTENLNFKFDTLSEEYERTKEFLSKKNVTKYKQDSQIESPIYTSAGVFDKAKDVLAPKKRMKT